MIPSVIPAKAGTQERRLAVPGICVFMGPGLRRDDVL
jgi:hypothetical protein